MRVGDRRQETGDRRNGEFRVGRSKNCQNDFSAQLLPKILSMHEHEELKTRHFFRPQKGTCLYMSMLLDLISKP
ncbi:MAG: hypothetical protein F6K18_15175 [Okeania sp. SIO2C2]|uniref:hypothetical protein n=1 Tax=Okeania sp. SIO2C2 TaxID=2607787 RepID=UPI0013B901F6|nr:hypothetical protein [Okeania sp. SIO2C2]NEP88060.1 hypothetical protein [Okeania sp. SIO2C2]